MSGKVDACSTTEIPIALWDGLAKVLGMQHPSVAGLLRTHGYTYEAGCMDELNEAFRNSRFACAPRARAWSDKERSSAGHVLRRDLPIENFILIGDGRIVAVRARYNSTDPDGIERGPRGVNTEGVPGVVVLSVLAARPILALRHWRRIQISTILA